MSIFQIDPDISKAKTIDTAFYNDPAVFEFVRRKYLRPPGSLWATPPVEVAGRHMSLHVT
jgi:hypothetical protein